MAARRTPPRRGVSAAWTVAAIATPREPIRRATKSVRRPCMPRSSSVLREPDVLELLIGEMAGRRDPVLDLRPVHDVARPPETGHVVGVLQHDLLELDDELSALGGIERARLPGVQVVDRGVREPRPVLWRTREVRRQQL